MVKVSKLPNCNYWYFYKNFDEQGAMVPMKGTTAITYRIFLYSIDSAIAYAPALAALVVGNRQLSKRKLGY